MFRIWQSFRVIAFIFFFGTGWVRASSNDSFDANAAVSGFDDPSLSFSGSSHHWDFSFSAGRSSVADAHTSITSSQANVQVQAVSSIFFLNFAPRDLTTESVSNGYALQLSLMRQILNDWVALGVQGGVSVGHSQTVEEGSIPFSSFDQSGKLISSSIVNYNIDYKFLLYHLEPIVRLGPWIPLNKWAWRPYVSAGGSVNQVIETAVLNSVGQTFEIAQRNNTSLGLLAGAGLDFRFSSSGIIGAEYQYQRVFASPHDWILTAPTIRLAYEF